MLHLEDASGNAVRLVHLPGNRSALRPGGSGGGFALQKTALPTTVTPSAGTSGDDAPLTVSSTVRVDSRTCESRRRLDVRRQARRRRPVVSRNATSTARVLHRRVTRSVG
jgi:hypothetical protein